MALTLTEAQKQIVKDSHRFRVVNCGRQFGKTTLAILEMVGKAVAAQDRKVAYIATTYQQARDIAWRDLKKLVEPVTIAANESRLEIEIRTQDGGTSLIFLRGWEAVESLRGQKFHFVVIDEVASMRNFWQGWEEVIRPTLTHTAGEVLFLSTPKGYNHFYEIYHFEEKNAHFKSFTFTTYDNPYAKPEEIESAKLQMTEDRFAQEYLASFRKMEGLVYKEFIRERHVYTEGGPNQVAYRFLGIDFGYTNPAAVLTIVKDSDAHYWITSEYYKQGKTTQELIDYAKTQQTSDIYPDPAEPDRIQEFRRAGFYPHEVIKDIVPRIAKVRELFKANRIHIHASCVNLIDELESYHYPENRPTAAQLNLNSKEIPVKENDHACDALGYALYMVDTISRSSAKQYRPSWARGLTA